MNKLRLEAFVKRYLESIVIVFCIALSASCVTSPPTFIEAPKPPASARLRVFVQALQNSAKWRTPYPEFARLTFGKVRKVWYDTGIYDVVSVAEADAALGSYRSRMSWKSDGYALAIEAARALWADYAMLVERVQKGSSFWWRTTLINARTGAVFLVFMNVPGGSRDDFQTVIQASYEQLFRDARADMLATATYRKSGGELPRGPAVSLQAGSEVARDIVFQEPAAALSAAPVIAIYDIKSTTEDNLITSILSEALRAEIHALGRFRLVSRENMETILEEMELQMSGLVDEKFAVKAGAGLAAQQIVVGQFGAVGKSSVLQAKRIDVATQRTLGLHSIRCETGSEEQLLDSMASLAMELSRDS